MPTLNKLTDLDKNTSHKKIWLLSPDIGLKEKQFVDEAFETNWIAPLGPNVTLFEKELSAYLNQSNVHVVSSGTAAIHLSLLALNVQEGDIVLCQSFTFAGSAFPINYLKAIPVFIDSEMETMNMDPVALEEAIEYYISINKKPSAIIVVHLYGMPAKMNALMAIASKYQIPVIEDAAEAMGSYYNNIPCGAIGDLNIVSFNGNKIITTSGGGAIISHNNTLIDKARHLSNHAKEDADYYLHNTIGYNYRLSNVLAGIGRGQLATLDEKVKRKREIHQLYEQLLSETNVFTFLKEPADALTNRWLTTVVFNTVTDSINPTSLMKYLAQFNIESRLMWNPMHLQPVYKDSKFFGSDVSENLFRKGFCLPSATTMSDDDVVLICELIKNYIHERQN